MKISPDLAKLSDAQLRRVRELEEKLGVILVAHEKVPVLSDLSREDLRALQEMEKRLGLILVAYRPE